MNETIANKVGSTKVPCFAGQQANTPIQDTGTIHFNATFHGKIHLSIVQIIQVNGVVDTTIVSQ